MNIRISLTLWARLCWERWQWYRIRIQIDSMYHVLVDIVGWNGRMLHRNMRAMLDRWTGSLPYYFVAFDAMANCSFVYHTVYLAHLDPIHYQWCPPNSLTSWMQWSSSHWAMVSDLLLNQIADSLPIHY